MIEYCLEKSLEELMKKTMKGIQIDVLKYLGCVVEGNRGEVSENNPGGSKDKFLKKT